MRTFPECVLCYERAALSCAKRFHLPAEKNDAMIKAVLQTMADSDLRDSPPVNARKIYEVIAQFTGIEDPFLEEKDRSTECALQLMPLLQEELAKFRDPFEGKVKLAMAGNIIDYGIFSDLNLNTAREKIIQAFSENINREELENFRRKLQDARNILYLTDNCGEAVFDSMLMEPYKDKVTVAVRGKPILNDVTRREAEESGLIRNSARLIDTGDNTPGIDLSRCSQEFSDAYYHADLIVSKGQGNYESLSEEKRPIVFLLRAKCAVVVDFMRNVKLGSCQIRHVHAED